MSKKRKCIFCGKEYDYCPHCGKYGLHPEWMALYDTEKCHDLYNVIAGYNLKNNTKENVKEMLDKYGVTDFSEFTKPIQNTLKKIFPPKEDIPKDDIPKDDNPKEDVSKGDVSKGDVPKQGIGKKHKKPNKKYGFERRVNAEE